MMGKYSEVTKKHKLIELETPNLVSSKQIMIKYSYSGSINARAKPKTPPTAKHIYNVFLVPNTNAINPDIKHARDSDKHEMITFSNISPGMYFM